MLFPLLLVAFGCTLPFTTANTSQALEERIGMLWEARIKGDQKSVYEMTDARFKKEFPLERFLKRGDLVVEKFTIEKVEVSEDGREGSSMVFFDTYRMGYPFQISIKEIWLFEEGAWHVKMSGLPTPFDRPPGVR